MGLTRAHASNLSIWHCVTCISQDAGTGSYTNHQSNVPPAEGFASQLAQLKSTTPIIQRLPKSVRIALAEELSTKVNAVVAHSTVDAWWELLTFSYTYLRMPKESKKQQNGTLASHIRSLMSNPCLPAANVMENNTPGGATQNAASPANLAKRVQAKCADGDIRAALRLLTTDDSIADRNEDTERALREKHPSRSNSSELPPEQQDIQPLQAAAESVLAALSSMPAGSGAGLDGLRPKHLQDLTAKSALESGRRLLTSLAKLANVLLSGGVPDFARGALFGASLCALRKKDGGIRPIAVGSVLRRVTAKMASKYASELMASTFKPKQLGVGVPGGCEAAIHSAREFVRSSHSSPEQQILVKVDVRNAFNSIDRTAFLQKILDHCPQIYPLLRQAYGFSSPLFYGEMEIHSETGLHQGDPLASLAFSLAIHPIIRSIDCPFNAWYLDDGVFGGTPEQVCGSLAEVERSFAVIGLQLNHRKCEVAMLNSPSGTSQAAALAAIRRVMPGIEETPSNNLTLLGSPLEPEGLDDSIARCGGKVELMCDRVKQLDSHWALFFLSKYASAPRFNHLLRTSPAYLLPAGLHRMDAYVRATLVESINVDLTDEAWAQATLPVRFGGLGVRSVSDLALVCYNASMHSALDLMRQIYAPDVDQVPPQLTAAVSAFRTKFPDCDPPAGESAKRQRAWDDISCETRFEELVEPSNQLHRARLLAAREPHSGAWIKAVPLAKLGLHLDDATVRVSVALRLGAPICEPHSCRCGRRVDRLGHHGLSCRYSAGRLPRHANLNDVVKRALTAAGIPAWLEPVGLDRGDGRRPDGVTVFPYSQGKCLVWDATCVDTYSASSLVDAAISPGSAAATAEDGKRRKYASLVDRYQFEPVALETTGVVGTSTKAFLQRLGKRISAQSGDRRETSWLFERLSLAVVRGNSASILATGCVAA